MLGEKQDPGVNLDRELDSDNLIFMQRSGPRLSNWENVMISWGKCDDFLGY